MTGGLPPRPRPPTLPQIVGEGESRIDVAKLTDRGIAVKALDLILRMQHAMQVHASEFLSFRKDATDDKAVLLKQIDDYERRISCLEGRPREAAASSHEWNELLTTAGNELSRRVKDTRDGLDSNRARAIAMEVVHTVKTAEDAKSFRSLKARGMKVIYHVLVGLLSLAAGFAASHYGLGR
jgi:hypothetical protein